LAIERLLLRGKVSLLTLYALFLLLESFFLLFDPLLLSIDDLLLLIDRVYQNGCELPVFDSFDFGFIVAGGQKRFDLLDLFGAKTDIVHSAVFPGK